LQPSRDISDFLDAPVGRYLAGHSFVIWAHSATLAGSAYFDRPGEADYPVLLALRGTLAHHASLRAGYDAIIDCSGLQTLSAASFSLISDFLRKVPIAAPAVGRVAIVRPTGVAGAAVTGLFYEFVKPAFDGALFTDLGGAFGWLGRADGLAAQTTVQDMLEQVRGNPPLLRLLRAHLAQNLASATLEDSARSLGHSGRSLQRRLKELGTHFRAELHRSRVCAAESLLIDTDIKLEEIARAVGCSSPSQLSVLFRVVTGETPSDFRARRRG
jgi:AraC-like DNA-binding protein